jgi:Icc-related predicted phosphoesterase
MNIRILSDLHTEFKPFDVSVTPEDSRTTLVLAGDIAVGTESLPWFKCLCERFMNVVYVLGNHEFYHGEINFIRRFWKKEADKIDNWYVLDNDTVILGDVRFIGATLWTDLMEADAYVGFKVASGISDYSIILFEDDEDNYRRLTPLDTKNEHAVSVNFIEMVLKKSFDGKTVVVTHHAPLPACVSEKFRGHPLNCAFHSNLEHLFRQYEFDVWIHGHMHDSVYLEDVYGKTVVCNPRGYAPNEINPNFQENLVLSVNDIKIYPDC